MKNEIILLLKVYFYVPTLMIKNYEIRSKFGSSDKTVFM